jgi:hypothetical protein
MYDLFIDDVYQKLEKFSCHHLIDVNNVYAHEKEDMPKYVVGDENYEMEIQNRRITQLLTKLDSKLPSFNQGIISSLICLEAYNYIYSITNLDLAPSTIFQCPTERIHLNAFGSIVRTNCSDH